MSARGAVLAVMAAEPDRRWFALELARAVHRPAGTLYPVLARLELQGLVVAGWEGEPASRGRGPLVERLPDGRRPRRWYELAGPGVREAARQRQHAPAGLRLRPRPQATAGALP